MCHFRPILNHFGLTEQQWRILRALSDRERLEPWEICEICQILSPSLAGVLARMDDMGLVIRSRVPEDQRRVIVRLSSRGEKMAAAILPLVEAQYKIIEEAFGRDLVDELYAVLDKFVAEPRQLVAHVELPNTAASTSLMTNKKKSARQAKEKSHAQ
ncbi:MAG: MarR family transcriptional regulator [Betaproteobacteria bacterium]|nr:MarR family transcriptional regulator [Betaproteobacteria bacterium]